MTGLVKICGLTRIEQATAATEAGADLIGFNFANSRRRVAPETARDAIQDARVVNPGIRTVGLFVDASLETIKEVYETTGVDVVQLHGMPDTDFLDAIGLPAFVVVKGEPGVSQRQVLDYVETIRTSPLVEMILVDAYHPTLAGGTGTFADWDLAAELARSGPLMLAGGLRPENVGDAIAKVLPAAVDVASGVEKDGTKDPELMRAFVERARAGFARAGYSISSGTSSHDAP